ncbi:MAG: winged helix-turn-helix transcriptional regulator, partial [Bryobacterales bacterium]|nr:winged helix-turn-helix transcriptional regulator [Bryobacterales bacterium]
MATASSPGVASGSTGSFSASAALWRFGSFEVDREAEEIRKSGIRLHLPGQPFQILTILLEHAGQVVTREELRQWLWPEDPPADFDRSLNTAVNRLRSVLCDAAGSVRYIETLPRKGYRFVAPVERLVRPAKSAAIPANVPPAAAARELPGTARYKRALTLVAAAGALIAAAWIINRRAAVPTAAHIVALTGYPGAETTPSWSPDGTRVAFSWNGGTGSNLDVYVLQLGSAAPERLTESTGNEFAPRYSPDGRRIAFYRRAGDSAYLHIVSSVQRNLVRSAGFGLNVGPDVPFAANLAFAPAPDLAFLSWSPDAKDIAYVDKSSPGEPFSVFLLSVAGWRGEKITWPPPGIRGDGSPAFSPDGRQLAFVRSQNAASADLFVLSLDGGGARRLTWDNCRISGIAWTSGGKAIVFSSERSGEPALWRISMPGAVLERIPQVREPAVLPALAEKSEALAFARWPERQEIVRVPLPPPGAAAGSAGAERFNPDASNPEFSPGGTRVAFSSGGDGGSGIWVSDSTGKNPVRLTGTDRYSASPKWSPDGR